MFEFKIHLPKTIVDFIREFEEDLEGYLEERIMEILKADLEYERGRCWELPF